MRTLAVAALLGLVLEACGTGRTLTPNTSGTAGTGTAGTMGAAGITGIAGITGSAGVAGITGIAGTCGQRPDCLASLCGNGQRDSCVLPATSCPAVTITESCDGADVGPETCVSFGWGSGAFACTPDCNLDVTACRACATGPAILACGDAPVAGRPVSMGLGATDTEVGLAWSELDDAGRASLSFARLGPDLASRGVSRLLDANPAPATIAMLGLAVVPQPLGWLISGYSEPEVFVRAVSATGADLGRTTVERVPSSDFRSLPIISPRPDGGALLVWQTAKGLLAAMVDGNGRVTASPRRLSISDPTLWSASIAYVDDGFFVAAAIEVGDRVQLRLQRIAPDGTAGTVLDALPGVETSNPRLVAGAPDLRVLYTGRTPGGDENSWGEHLQKLDAGGAASGASVFINGNYSGNVAYAAPFRGVALGSDTAVLLAARGDEGLGLARAGGSGLVVTPPFTVMLFPSGYMWSSPEPGLARRGTDVIVGWFGESGIELARINP